MTSLGSELSILSAVKPDQIPQPPTIAVLGK